MAAIDLRRIPGAKIVRNALLQQAQPAPQLSPEAKELLSQLHDIQEPAPVGWWPPAPGWWLLAGALFAAAIAFAFWLRRRRKLHLQNRYRVEAVRLLQEIDTSAASAPQTINEILKRVAVTTYGRQQCGNLTGRAWLKFLQNTAEVECPAAAEKALLEHLYRADSVDEAGNGALRDYAIDWVEQHNRKPHISTSTTASTPVTETGSV